MSDDGEPYPECLECGGTDPSCADCHGPAEDDSPAMDTLDAELLAWAKEKAKSPWEWSPGRISVVCVFCGYQQMLLWNGRLEPQHTDTCLAVRANTVKP